MHERRCLALCKPAVKSAAVSAVPKVEQRDAGESLLTKGQVARRLGVSKRTIDRLTDSDGFPKPVKIGSRPMWLPEHFDAYIIRKVRERDQQGVGAAL